MGMKKKEQHDELAFAVGVLKRIAQHDGSRWLYDDDGLPSVRQPMPQIMAQQALEVLGEKW